MAGHKIVSREQWLESRKQLLEKEKQLTRLGDELSELRRALPWVRVDKQYVFDTLEGPQSLAQLFAGRSQLLVYHFMFSPKWEAGCKNCSFWADQFDGVRIHLQQRDITLLAASRAPLPQLEAYRKRLGWYFKWVSSWGSDFNYDYHVSFTPEQAAAGEAFYNYRVGHPPAEESPGLSVFYQDTQGQVFHTYSCYARGLEAINAAYHLMDLAPNGRHEDGPRGTMTWVRRHDEYTLESE